MDLREYLFRERLKINQFAKKIKYTPTYVNAIINERVTPGRKVAEAIVEATNGKVTMEELMQNKETNELS